MALWLLIFLGLVPVVTGTSGSAESEGKMTKDTKEIKKKTRSLNGHKLQLTNHSRDCAGKIVQYKADKTLEVSDRIDQAWQKVLDQQVKIREIFDELHVLDEEQEASYTQQEEELNGQVDTLGKSIEAAKIEVAA